MFRFNFIYKIYKIKFQKEIIKFKSNFNLYSKYKFLLINFYLVFSFSGCMVACGYTNYSNDSESCDNKESENRSNAYRTQDMAFTHTRCDRIWSRCLYVPDKYRSDEESNRLFECCRLVNHYVIYVTSCLIRPLLSSTWKISR